MRELIFDEQSMRKFTDVNMAIKQYSAIGIPRRRIITLYNQTFSISVGSLSVNVNFLKTPSGEKFLENYIGKSGARRIAIETALKNWNDKFKDTKSDIPVTKRSSKTSSKPLPTDDNSENLTDTNAENSVV